jgi:malate dehydrogenase
VISYRGIASEVVLLISRFAEGKALDIMQCATNTGFTKVSGVTNDYSKTAGSDVVVITSEFQENQE